MLAAEQALGKRCRCLGASNRVFFVVTELRASLLCRILPQSADMKEFAFIHEHGTVPDSLRAVPFLESFNDAQLDDVLNSSSYIQCEEGDTIIKEGAVDSRIYILLSGEVHVAKDGKTLASIKRPGEVFGELAVVNDDRRSASVVAAKSSVCLAVDQKFLQDIKPREEHPAFYAALYEFIARVTAGRLQATSRRLAELELEVKSLQAKLQEKSKKNGGNGHGKTAAVRVRRPVAKRKLRPKPKRAARR
jgi:CRP/FNR family cyclic AMP-dependent transcriptional regulator